MDVNDNDLTLRQELEETRQAFSHQIEVVDADLLPRIKPGVTIESSELKNWYLLHAMGMVIDAALTQQTLVLPSDITVWRRCFGSQNRVLQAIWKQLIQMDHPNDDVIMPVLHDLQTAIETQMVPITIHKQLQTWSIQADPIIGMDLLRDEQNHEVNNNALKSQLKTGQDKTAEDILDSTFDNDFDDDLGSNKRSKKQNK